MSLADAVLDGDTKVDKIVRFFEGSYDRSTDLTRIDTIFAGFPWQYYVYVIPHGLGRPLFCEMIWRSSTSTVDWTDGGFDRVAYSDDQNIYIFDGISAGSGVISYKVWASWIDDYDGSNPEIDTVTYPDQPIQVDSQLNIQKIYSQTELNFTAGTFGAEETQSVPHPFNRTPNAKGWFESFTGQVWQITANPLFNNADNQDLCLSEIYQDRVDVIMQKYSGLARRAWLRIYYDED